MTNKILLLDELTEADLQQLDDLLEMYLELFEIEETERKLFEQEMKQEIEKNGFIGGHKLC